MALKCIHPPILALENGSQVVKAKLNRCLDQTRQSLVRRRRMKGLSDGTRRSKSAGRAKKTPVTVTAQADDHYCTKAVSS